MRAVNIYMEANPNPNSMKFVVNFMLLQDGISFDYPDKASAKDSPLAQQLFDLEGVERVFYMSNFITVTKSDSVEWLEIQDAIRAVIKPYLEDEKPLLLEELDKDPLFDENDSEVVKKIKGILDEYIRPAVEQDGGAIGFAAFEDGVVKVSLQGSCSGCPASAVTLKQGIENLLKRMLPEDVKEVVAEGV
ncbi:Fe-S cluster biogenesis protein NfuA [Roseivirga pacifica]|uniref:Fe-S cluster biogenesis protein NfuA, 4Fe-4S-binding domain n=1 Tax=Roseivirga pacifica TaxID=1267423 RepID=A0A1I0NKH7_9BACT|nr:NifU family protein [Roseivirga pacifica]RKQ51276.1 Fe-S cluster biogenesis protein NfuA [Roseivirga pacifica]SEW01997.1 Fe-S cluster biogenesis protein NfuA, 4Fe-4S-binding domain [Roseivirga pacifica]